jgi:hypothetical protein
MANKISVVIDVAVEKANAGLKSFKQSIADADGAAGKFKAGTQSVGQSITSNLGPPLLAAGVAVAAFAAKSIQAASDLSESTNAVNKSFGEAAEGVLELGESSAESMGLSKAAFNEAAVGFAAFAKGIAGEGGDAAEVVGDLTTRAADFASVMNMDVGPATDIFRSALSGETEPIKKFGIDLSAAAVEAYALSSGLVKSKDEMTEGIKVQARYGLLMQKTSQFAGDFADTSDGLANSTRIAQARITDFQAELGEKLLPVAAQTVGVVLDLADAVERLGVEGVTTEGRLTDGGFFEKLRDSAERAINPVKLASDTYGEIKFRLDELSESSDDASDATRKYQEDISRQSDALAINAARSVDSTAATEDSTEATEDAAEAAKEAAEAYEEQRRAIEASTEAHLAAIDSSLGYRNQQAQTAATVREAALIELDAKRSTEEHAQAARDAEGAVLDQAAAAVAMAEDQAAANGETLSAEEKARIYKEELEKLAGFLTGPAREAVLGYIEDLRRFRSGWIRRWR